MITRQFSKDFGSKQSFPFQRIKIGSIDNIIISDLQMKRIKRRSHDLPRSVTYKAFTDPHLTNRHLDLTDNF